MALNQSNHLSLDSEIFLAGLPVRDRSNLSCIQSADHKKLSQWCDDLNILNIEETVPSCIQLLRELAALNFNANEIFQMYLVILPTLARVKESVKTVYSQRKLLLTTQAKRAMELAHSLDRAIILMLRSLLATLCTQHLDEKSKHFISLVGNYLFIHMADIFQRLSEFCLSMPQGFWRECHAVYWQLHKFDCHDIHSGQVHFEDYPENLSPKRIYIALILYSIIEPSRYDRLLQSDLMHAMLNFATLVDLKKVPSPYNLFSVLMSEDVSHVPTRAITADEPPSLVLHLNLTPLVSFLQTPLADVSKMSKNQKVVRLFDEFYSLFTVERYRRQPRQEKNIVTKGYFGLLQIYNYLENSSPQTNTQVVEEISYDADHLKTIKNEVLIIKDESDGGLCVESKSKNQLIYEAGDILLLTSLNMRQLCVIRWTKLQSSGHNLLGLEKLAASPEAVEFSTIDIYDKKSETEKALLFNMPDRIVLLSRIMPSQGQTIEVLHNGHIKKYKVVELHWLISGYVQKILEPLG